METEAGKIRVVKTKRGRDERGSRKEMRRKGGEKEKETKKGKNDGSKEGGRRMGDLR